MRGNECVHICRMRGCVAYKVNDSTGSRMTVDVDYTYILYWRTGGDTRKMEWNHIIPREQEQKNRG